MKLASSVAIAVLVMVGGGFVEASPVVCTQSKLCRTMDAPKGARTLVADGAGKMWALGAKGQAWQEADGLFGKPVKTGGKKDWLASARMGEGVIAVGKGGQIVRVVSGKWTIDKSPAKKDLLGVWASSGDAAWAVGKAGTIVRFEGGKWTAQKSPVKVDLHAVWGAREGEVWAVGDKGTILRHDGQAWTVARTGNARLLTVGGTSEKLVFAAGDTGAVVRWEGKAWNPVQTGYAGDFTAVVSVTAAEVFLLGSDGAGVRMRDREWDPAVAGEDGFLAVAMRGTTAFILAQDGAIWSFAGGWKRFESPTGNGINAMSGWGENVVAGGEHGLLAIRQGGKWEQPYKKVEGVRTLMGAGWDGKAAFGFDYDGHLVSVVPGQKPVVTKKAVGAPKGFTMNNYWQGEGIGYAIGSRGTLTKLENGKWELVPVPIDDLPDFEAVHGVGKDLLMLTGADGNMFHWDGKTWTKHATGDSGSLRAVFVADKDFAVAGGTWGLLVMWDGVSWNRIELPVKGMWRSACGTSRTEIYMGSNDGEIVRWDGRQWFVEGSPSGQALRSCYITPSGEVWFGEQNGGLVFRQAERATK